MTHPTSLGRYLGFVEVISDIKTFINQTYQKITFRSFFEPTFRLYCIMSSRRYLWTSGVTGTRIFEGVCVDF